MRGPRTIIGLAALLALLALVSTRAAPAGADAPAYKVIVNPDLAVTTVDASFLRDAYLKKISDWSDGTPLRPVALSDRHPVRARFVRDVLHKTPAQLRSYWNQQIFSGKRMPPPQVDSPAAAIAYVLANRGAVAYIPADVDAGRARVVTLR
jgi:hypothetical protein